MTAEQIVNDWSEDRLGKIIRDYGEERYWKSIARRIAEARTVSRIRTTGELVGLVGGPRPGRRELANTVCLVIVYSGLWRGRMEVDYVNSGPSICKTVVVKRPRPGSRKLERLLSSR